MTSKSKIRPGALSTEKPENTGRLNGTNWTTESLSLISCLFERLLHCIKVWEG
jgi:hypothetical protein